MTEENKALATTKENAKLDQAMTVINAAGIDAGDIDMSGAEVIQSGGVTKWVDLTKFQVDEKAPQNQPVAGNGKAFAGALLSRQEIPVGEKESGEVKADGTKVRFYYLLRLVAPCPVAYKDENKDPVEEIAQPGEVVAIGERDKLRPLRELCEDGGLYVVVLKPHSRIKIGGGHTMWTFDIVKKTIRPPMRAQVQVLPPKTPF